MLNSNQPWATSLKDKVIKRRKPIAYHVSSSLWSSMKNEYPTILENSSWLLGNGEHIRFWSDNWCGVNIADSLHIPQNISEFLSAPVKDFIVNSTWCIPNSMQQASPHIYQLIHSITIPKVPLDDRLVWKWTNTGNLTLKEAFLHKTASDQKLNWAKIIWSVDIPPSKSLVSWRIMHDRMPTDEKLMEKGCNIVSICNNCLIHTESTLHLFSQCRYAVAIWSWLASILSIPLHLNNISDIWKLCDRKWTPQCKVAITSCLNNILSTIWYVRNQNRFHNKKINWKSAINIIISNTSLSGNKTVKTSAVDMRVCFPKSSQNQHSPSKGYNH